MSWLNGMPAEFSDPRFPSYGEGREGEWTHGGLIAGEKHGLGQGYLSQGRRGVAAWACSVCAGGERERHENDGMEHGSE